MTDRKASIVSPPRTVSFEDRTLPRLLMLRAELGEKPFIRSVDRDLSFAGAPDCAARIAGLLARAGVNPGDRVAVFLSNRIEFLEVWFGVTWLGAIVAPINTAFQGNQLQHAIRLSEPRVIVAEEHLLPQLRQVSSSLSGVSCIILADHNSANTSAVHSLDGVPVEPMVLDAKPVEAWPVKPSDAAAILYTSGTTGPSKGVICPHAQFYWWGILTGELLEITGDEVLFTVLPFFHTNALNTVWQALLNGASCAFRSRFSASRFWQQCREVDATVSYLLGAMVQILLQRDISEFDPQHRLRVALSPATGKAQVMQFWERFDVALVEGYGSTETNVVLSNVIGSYAPGTMGRVVDGFEVRVVDENDRDVEDGQAGELLVRHREPFSVASGYFGDPAATVRAWRNLWFHTGDRVVCEPDGTYRFVDRTADAIRRRGENISSWEVEQALTSHPDVANAAVVGVPSELGEEEVMAFVVPCEGRTVDPTEMTSYLETRLAHFAIPRYVKCVSDLPLTENGKIRKHALRSADATAGAWDRQQADRAGDRSRKKRVDS